jgi:hypothetical protein
MEQRLLGQDVTVRLVRDGVVIAEVATIGSFDDSMDTEIKQEEFLGHTSADYSEVFDGFSGNLEFQSSKSGYVEVALAIEARATRADPSIVFNVVRTDQYANGDSNIFVYKDVAWGPMPSTIGNRKEFVKHKLSFKCSERQVVRNSLM